MCKFIKINYDSKKKYANILSFFLTIKLFFTYLPQLQNLTIVDINSSIIKTIENVCPHFFESGFFRIRLLHVTHLSRISVSSLNTMSRETKMYLIRTFFRY